MIAIILALLLMVGIGSLVIVSKVRPSYPAIESYYGDAIIPSEEKVG